MSRIARHMTVAAVAAMFSVPLAGAAGGQASEDVRTADIHGSVPVQPAKKVPMWQGPRSPRDTYDNGSFLTHPGGGAGGADASRLQNTSLAMTSLGFTASDAGAFRIADDFQVPAPGWNLNTITLFGYQTGSTTTSTFDVARVQIWSGAPNGGGVVVFGDITTNRFVSTAFTNVYRDTETTVANNQRPIMSTTAATSTSLSTPGSYWVDYQLGGTLASGPFSPPLTTTGSTSGTCVGTCNGLQWSGTAWVALDDGLAGVQPQDIKFVIDYLPAPVELESFGIE